MAIVTDVYGGIPLAAGIPRAKKIHIIPQPMLIYHYTDVQVPSHGIHITAAHRFTDVHDVIVERGVIIGCLTCANAIEGSNSPPPAFKECLFGIIVRL